MALQTGVGEEVIAQNAANLVKAGWTLDDAQAIAQAHSREYTDLERVLSARQQSKKTLKGHLSNDRAFYTTTSLGKRQHHTPEGFLVCEDVTLCRTGTYTYRSHEMPGLRAGKDGLILVNRSEAAVFHPNHLSSIEGKSVTWDHPKADVSPSNYKLYEFGTLHNPHRGESIEDDLVLVDMLIKDPECIKYAKQNKPEVSEGYRADYEDIEPGLAEQSNIICNHVALVRQGRAGPRCRVRDSLTLEEPTNMSKARNSTNLVAQIVGRLISRGVPAQDAATAANEIVADVDAEAGGTATQQPPSVIVVNTTDAKPAVAASAASGQVTLDSVLAAITTLGTSVNDRLAKLEAKTVDAAPAKTAAQITADEEEEKRKAKEKECTGDTIIEAEEVGKIINLGKVYTGDQAPLISVHSRAEILAPGITLPTRDSLEPNKDGKPLAAFMRNALTRAEGNPKFAGVVKAQLGGRTVDSLTGYALLAAFNGAAEGAKTVNTRNQGNPVGAVGFNTKDHGNKKKTITEIQDGINKYREQHKAASNVG